MKKAIRTEYEEKGVEGYYKKNANVYENPHFPYIKSLLVQNQHRIDYSRVIDLCCGGGEVTLVLSEIQSSQTNHNNKNPSHTYLGCDPFTFKLYEKNTGCPCLSLSFEDVIKGKMTPSVFSRFPTETTPFSAIICSFAMHLCPEKQLYALVYQLFTYANNIIIITPHKRPQLEKISGVEMIFDDFVLTERGKKVFLKNYKLS